jgi:hypothetical protein
VKKNDDDGIPKDSHGSAKVALIAIDRSIAAWEMMLSYFAGQKGRFRILSDHWSA